MSLGYSRITGTGSALPARVVSNDELARDLAKRGVETSDEWIVARTGIRQRYLAEPGVTTADLGAKAARAALQAAGRTVGDIDLIVVATSTPDQIFPSTACLVQAQLGADQLTAFDVQAVCSGFVYGLVVADALIRTGMNRKALVIGAEVFSRILDWNDRATCVLFGDGAGAAVLESSNEPGLITSELKADGSHAGVLCTNGRVAQGKVEGHAFLTMDGPAVFKLAVNVLGASALNVLQQAGVKAEQLDWLIPHQANVRILNAIAKKVGVPEEKLVATVDQHGNTSAASIPLALDVAVRDGRIKSGQHVMLQGVGGGFTWGSALLRW
ncbi:MAG TPA: beta-ketoacyl-ACP synthase III [Burkholderiaceae bacterium]|jgi:3-oxoacyl-[acyl-carrier-protein] synthase III|nr:beta-ketoacyl-ACP synthase III [Burkholderiaceae bacterium]